MLKNQRIPDVEYERLMINNQRIKNENQKLIQEIEIANQEIIHKSI